MYRKNRAEFNTENVNIVMSPGNIEDLKGTSGAYCSSVPVGNGYWCVKVAP